MHEVAEALQDVGVELLLGNEEGDNRFARGHVGGAVGRDGQEIAVPVPGQRELTGGLADVGAPEGIEAMGWDGSRWRLQATPDPYPVADRAGNTLAAVSCTSSNDCVAVGEYFQRIDYDPASMKELHVEIPLAERWNGVRWSVLPFPSLPTGAQQGALDAVSCTSSSACEAVGAEGVGHRTRCRNRRHGRGSRTEQDGRRLRSEACGVAKASSFADGSRLLTGAREW